MLDKTKIAILLPTLDRPFGLSRVLLSLHDTAPMCPIVVATDPSDNTAREIAKAYKCKIVTTKKDKCGCHAGWNTALRNAPPDAVAFVLAADDVEFQPGWLDEGLRLLESELNDSGVVGFEDDKKRPKGAIRPFSWATHYLMTRDHLININGGVMAFEQYYCDFTDVETCDRARRAGKFVMAWNAHVTHHWGGFNFDTTYSKSNPYRAESKILYEQRKAAGFPDDHERILTK